MNAFREHHQHNMRMHYRCFDRVLLMESSSRSQEERVVGFFNTYRKLYPVRRNVLREIASQFHNWVKDRSPKWQAPIQSGLAQPLQERFINSSMPWD